MKVFLDSIGCRLNQSEIEKFGSQLSLAGYTVVETLAEADMVVVNTCAVTGKAASDSRAAIRRASQTGDKKIIVTGCWSTLEPVTASNMPGVQKVIPNRIKDNLAEELTGFATDNLDNHLSDGKILRKHQRTRAFIKVQDGCDNHCTFCITRIARGESRSRGLNEILNDIKLAFDAGTKEVVLTGVNLGSWGRDHELKHNFRDLIETILIHTQIPRLRLSSLEPWDLDRGFFDLWTDKRLCRHLHLPLQSGSARVLKLMARKITPEQFFELASMARKISPEIAITTDIMVGFPGEGENEFLESMDFVRSINFADGHVFNFSARPGTPAATMQYQVAPDVRKERSIQIRELVAIGAKDYREKSIGTTQSVLWEYSNEVNSSADIIEGLSDNYLHIKARSHEPRWNIIDSVKIESISGSSLNGQIIY